MGGKINNLNRFPYFQGADLNKDTFFSESLFFKYLLPKGTVRANLLLINPYLGYFLWAEIPRFSPPKRPCITFQNLFFNKKKHKMEVSCANLMSLYAVQQQQCWAYTECPRRKGPNFGRVFLMLNYTDITQNTYIQS